jgi:hypothetical protein
MRLCRALTRIVLPSSIEALWVCAFQGCVELTHVLPPSVKKIVNGVFADCSGLTSSMIPHGVDDCQWGTATIRG